MLGVALKYYQFVACEARRNERVYITDKNGSPKLDQLKRAEIWKQVTGEDPMALYLTEDREQALKQPLAVKFCESQSDLRRALMNQRNEQGVFIPIGASIHVGESRTEGGWHAVVVFDYDPETDTVGIDNSWSPESDFDGQPGHRKRMPLSEFAERTGVGKK